MVKPLRSQAHRIIFILCIIIIIIIAVGIAAPAIAGRNGTGAVATEKVPAPSVHVPCSMGDE